MQKGAGDARGRRSCPTCANNGVRTTLVLTFDVAPLATSVNPACLGNIIGNGCKLGRLPVQIAGAAVTKSVALFIDWVAIFENFLRPRGL